MTPNLGPLVARCAQCGKLLISSFGLECKGHGKEEAMTTKPNLTPETLKQWFLNRHEWSNEVGKNVVLNVGLDYADAWEADRRRLEALVAAVNNQVEDEGLWFIAETAPEAYLQNALRLLHALVEGDDFMAALAAGEEKS